MNGSRSASRSQLRSLSSLLFLTEEVLVDRGRTILCDGHALNEMIERNGVLQASSAFLQVRLLLQVEVACHSEMGPECARLNLGSGHESDAISGNVRDRLATSQGNAACYLGSSSFVRPKRRLARCLC